MIVYCATSNPGKLREFRLAGHQSGHFNVEALAGLRDIPPPEETGQTFEENAVQKTLYYAKYTDRWIFADDSGLEVEGLNGEPGVHSARYAGPNATDEDNNRLLLERLNNVQNRYAQFVCVIALAHEGQVVKTFRGAVTGEIIDYAAGSEGFGYDPLFYHSPFKCTFGEASAEMKMRVSHRAQALRQMFAFLRQAAANTR